MQILECYKPLFTSKERIYVLRGGAGSGKSVAVMQYILSRAITESGKFLLFRKFNSSSRHSTWSLLNQLIKDEGLTDICKINSSIFTIKFDKSEIVCMGLDDAEKIKSVAGVKLVWLEESSEFEFEDFLQLNTRLRDNFKDGDLKLILSFNPISHLHWLKTKIWDNKEISCERIFTTYKNNKFLSQEYKNTLEDYKNIDENHYKIYCLGEWGNISGLNVYTKTPVKVTTLPKMNYETWYSCDFGFQHPTTFVEFNKNGDSIYVKLLIYESKLTTNDLINKLNTFTIKNDNIYCDTARPETIQELRVSRYRAVNANKSVMDGISFVKSIWDKLIFVENELYSNIERELNLYKFKQDKDEVVKENDDFLDALRYGLYTHLKGKTQTSLDIIKSIDYGNSGRY